MKKHKAIIFGCGVEGNNSFPKLSRDFEVAAFSDNNASLWGTERLGVSVIPPHDLFSHGDAAVIVCVAFGFIDIARQLEAMGKPCFIYRYGLLYEYRDTVLYPAFFESTEVYKKTAADDFSVLFVQEAPCSRTDKISCSLKQIGVVTHNAYVRGSSNMAKAYEKEHGFYSYDDLLNFVNNSQFDIIHCSNEPDVLTNLLLQSNKKIIYDAHDLITVRNNDAGAELYFLEYMANKFSEGYLYTNDYSRDLQIERYGVSADKTLVIQNLPLERQFPAPERKKPKLSAADGELHLVYEGGISDSPVSNRYFENLWKVITACKIHIHFFSQQNIEYCKALEKTSPYLHYEGNLSGLELIAELSRYDIGSILLNPVDKNVDMAYPNKLFEYLAAGLPVVSNLTAASGFAKSYQVGGALDFNGEIKGQLREYAKIRIPDSFLRENKLTMDSHAHEIVEFYKKIAGQSQAVKR